MKYRNIAILGLAAFLAGTASCNRGKSIEECLNSSNGHLITDGSLNIADSLEQRFDYLLEAGNDECAYVIAKEAFVTGENESVGLSMFKSLGRDIDLSLWNERGKYRESKKDYLGAYSAYSQGGNLVSASRAQNLSIRQN